MEFLSFCETIRFWEILCSRVKKCQEVEYGRSCVNHAKHICTIVRSLDRTPPYHTPTHDDFYVSSDIASNETNDNRCNKTCEPTRSDSKIGQGNLIKCYVHRIETDHTSGNCMCPKCNATFCFKREVKGRPAHKLIIDRVRIVRAKHGDC